MEYVKSVQFNRQDGDFSAVVNGQVISIHPTHAAAVAACNAYVLDCLTHPHSEASAPTHSAPAGGTVANISRQSVAAVVNEARAKVANDQRWLNAVNRAYSELELNQWVFDGQTLRIASRTQRITYHVTASACQCPAFVKHHKPCWHRASYRILSNAAQRAA